MQVWNEAINNHDYKLMINYGAVRSGKTFVDNFIFLHELKHTAKIAKQQHILMPQYILAGTSSKTIANNVLNSLYNTFGLTFQHDNLGNFYIKFNGLPPVKIAQAYDKTIAGLGGIRGGTSYGAYVNEAILANPRVFQEIYDRCSGKGSHMICDTNPGAPNSFLLSYIKNPSKKIIANHFTFKDNKANLDPSYYYGKLATTPSGAFYERSINGNFVANSGMIYKDFDKKRNQISPNDVPSLSQLHLFGGVDFGYNHFESFTVLGQDVKGCIYLLEERTRRLETSDYWITVAHDLVNKYGNIPFYCDTNNPENIKNLQRAGIRAQYAYKNQGSVVAGIKLIATLMKSGKFKRVTNESDISDKQSMNDAKQTNFMDNIYQYVWEKNSVKDKPHKVNDDVVDSFRYPIYTRYSEKKAKQDQPSDENQVDIFNDLGLL